MPLTEEENAAIEDFHAADWSFHSAVIARSRGLEIPAKPTLPEEKVAHVLLSDLDTAASAALADYHDGHLPGLARHALRGVYLNLSLLAAAGIDAASLWHAFLELGLKDTTTMHLFNRINIRQYLDEQSPIFPVQPDDQSDANLPSAEA